VPTPPSKVQRWTDLLAALLIRRFPAPFDELARDIPAYSAKGKSDTTEAIGALRDQQTKERQWHTDAWAKESRLYDEIDEGRREVSSRIRAISEASSDKKLQLIGA